MIIVILLCLAVTVTAGPVTSKALPSQLAQRGVTQAQTVQPVDATNQNLENPTPAPHSAILEQPETSVPQQQAPQSLPQLSPFLQQYTWSPQGGSPLIIPLQPNVQGFQPTNQLMLSQQPLIVPSFGYFPMFSTPYSSHLVPPYVNSMIPETPVAPASPYRLPNSPVSPAENPAGATVFAGTAPQSVQPQQQQQQQQQIQQQQPQLQQQQQQQQNPQRVVYMLQQPISSPLGSLSSEELQMAAKMGQLGVYMPTLLSNQPVGAALPQGQAAGLTNPAQQGASLTVEASAAGAPQPQRQPCAGSQPDAAGGPAGLEAVAQEAGGVRAAVQPKVQHTEGNAV